MKDFCKYCFNDPVIYNCQKELCGTCEMETEVAKKKPVIPSCDNCIKESYCPMRSGEMSCTGFQSKRENICFKCEHFSYCSMAVHRDDGKVVMTGCSRFEEKHKQTRGDWLRSMTDEELAKWFVNLEVKILNIQPMLERPALEKDWLEWLQKECE